MRAILRSVARECGDERERGLLHVALVLLLVREEPLAVVVLAQDRAESGTAPAVKRGLIGHGVSLRRCARETDHVCNERIVKFAAFALEQRSQLAL
jgi:hypothetical protein